LRALTHSTLAQALRAESNNFDDATTTLKVDLEDFVETSTIFKEGAESIIAAHRRNRTTLQNHMQILDVLELPQLMDACVRNGLYEGALDIAAFANVLERRHALRPPRAAVAEEKSRAAPLGGAGVILGVVSEIRAAMVVLRGNLLRQLRAPIQLPLCLSVISCLRRLDTLVLEKAEPDQMKQLSVSLELKLQVDFLDARTVWLQLDLEALKRSGAARRSVGEAGAPVALWLLDMVEKNRTLWFEIGTQFRAIFTSDEAGGAADKTADLVLSSWVVRRVEGFVSVLQEHLPRVRDGAQLHDLFEHAMFMGASLGRLGADFRPLLAPLFEDAALEMVTWRWRDAEAVLAASLKAVSSNDLSLAALPLHLPALRRADEATPATAAAADSKEPPEPPLSTLAFPALAQALNLLLDSLNHLRQCAPRSLRAALEAQFEATLRRVAKMLAKHTEVVAGRPSDAETAALLWREAGEVALPHACAALAFVYSGSESSLMAARLSSALVDAFLTHGLAVAKPQRHVPNKPTPPASAEELTPAAPIDELTPAAYAEVAKDEAPTAPQVEVRTLYPPPLPHTPVVLTHTRTHCFLITILRCEIIASRCLLTGRAGRQRIHGESAGGGTADNSRDDIEASGAYRWRSFD
jgi:hypothetical protein